MRSRPVQVAVAPGVGPSGANGACGIDRQESAFGSYAAPAQGHEALPIPWPLQTSNSRPVHTAGFAMTGDGAIVRQRPRRGSNANPSALADVLLEPQTSS